MSAVWNLAPREIAAFPPLQNSVEIDVAIVGGGITGLATALILSDAGERVAVLEARSVGEGSTGGSTGNLYATVSQGLAALKQKWDLDVIRQVVAMRRQAMNDMERNVQQYAMDCQFERRPLYFCVQDESEEHHWLLQQEQQISADAGLATEILREIPGSGLPVTEALRIEGQAQVNPLQYCRGLARAVTSQGGKIYEHSPVTRINAGEGKVSTANGVVTAGNIVLATHTPKGVNMLQAEMEVYREHGIALPLKDPSADHPQGVFWMLDGFHSVRSYHHQGRTYVVVVGQKHETGHGACGEGHFEELEDYARRYFQVEGSGHRWSAQQYQPADRLPYIGHSGHDNVFVATGYSADGLVWSEVAAQVLSHQILGQKDADAQLFNPRRFTPGKSARSWWETNAKVARHLSTEMLGGEKLDDLNRIEPGEGRVVKFQGSQYAIYRSPEGGFSALSPVCPHLKCKVHWNAADKSWDCPCHGSRFDPHGAVIEGPAYHSLEKKSLPDQKSRTG